MDKRSTTKKNTSYKSSYSKSTSSVKKKTNNLSNTRTINTKNKTTSSAINKTNNINNKNTNYVSNKSIYSNNTNNKTINSKTTYNNINNKNYSNTSNINKKKKKKKKLNIYACLDVLIILVVTIGLIYIVINHNKKSNTSNIENSENNLNNENIENNENGEKEPDPPSDPNKEKLKKLGYINEDLDFFKMDYLDRYIEYKENNPDLDNETVVVYVNIGLDRKFYTNVLDSPNKYTNTVLANKFYYLGSDYVPKDLTTINKEYTSDKKQMTKEAALAFESMAKDAKKSGYNIRAVSTYRSYSYQTSLYENYAKSDGKEKADTYSARAGYSEHQTGLAVDVDNTKVSYTKFGNSIEFGWMKENCYKYGFILRYTKETEFITGYMNEPWHYRYVGKEIAKYIHDNPMTYEEYYVRFLEGK